MDDLTAFLRARLDEVEQYADDYPPFERMLLADVAAKRQIIDRSSNDAKYPNFDGGYETAIDDVLALLALPHADHPDYNESWRP